MSYLLFESLGFDILLVVMRCFSQHVARLGRCSSSTFFRRTLGNEAT